MFNAQFKARIESGQYTLTPIKAAPPAKPNNLPEGTKSTIFEINNNQGAMVGKCHAMVLPDDSYGGSGQLDPKALVVGTTLYILESPPAKVAVAVQAPAPATPAPAPLPAPAPKAEGPETA